VFGLDFVMANLFLISNFCITSNFYRKYYCFW